VFPGFFALQRALFGQLAGPGIGPDPLQLFPGSGQDRAFLYAYILISILRPFPGPYSGAGACIGKHPGNAGNGRHAPIYGYVLPGKK
jgi:hypothetical protein